MIIDSIIIDQEQSQSTYLKKCLLEKFPEISIRGEASTYSEANKLINAINPALVFFNINAFKNESFRTLHDKKTGCFELIYISERPEDAINAIRQNACGFILKPFNFTDIVLSVASAIKKMTEKISPVENLSGNTLPHTKLIGIPTFESMEFIYAHEIIRCEGLQKCTNILSTRRGSLVSAYNIGEFRKLLDQSGFFLCHKSHLINLMHVRRLTRDGFIVLSDHTTVPLARRKRPEFLELMTHL
ncbi:LytR/AlgR family response regulator transcription factor [Pseudochryseolinea flava]|uniref:HTH LytTR-type domain-containing protein n=1 Tax=Pseudochryseolinea flava TaxID=2059302 RepID=A0A364Y4C8_9BACT|nr:LytTR family DNA-binding domain-containing protein [Pseudochryseolinea flava]RAW01599.1 hypothetical protein DQQ10_08040 [Pseudochryseolinea flava]